MLSDNFSDRNFEYTKVAYGVQQQQPRWKRALSFVQGIMGEAVGKSTYRNTSLKAASNV